MIAEYIKAAIIALIETDDGATDAEREAVVAALAGRRISDRVIPIGVAAKRMGLSRNLVSAYAKAGRLTGVPASRGTRLVGVTEESITNFK